MTADVKDIARFIVQHYIDSSNPTTNMKLQKMLYFAWIEFFKKTNKPLFENKIYAWKFGPVVPEVYNEYRIFAGINISFTESPKNIPRDVAVFLRGFADKYKDRTASGLVSRTHSLGGPWERVYKPDVKNTEIPFDLIIRLECQ